MVVVDPDLEWTGVEALRSRLAEWTRSRGKARRLYPGALVWCVKKPGRELRDKVEMMLAWRRVEREVAEGTLGGEFDRSDRAELKSKVADAEEAAKERVWADYRFAIIADGQEVDGIKAIDLGAGHSSSGDALVGRVLIALKSGGLLSESVGASYIERNWPPALKESGAWPLASLRQSFLDGSLTRLVDPDAVLKNKLVEFVGKGDFGVGSGGTGDGTYEHVWFEETMSPDEVAYDADVYLLRKSVAVALRAVGSPAPVPAPSSEPSPIPPPSAPGPQPLTGSDLAASIRVLRLVGKLPSEQWNRVGTKIIPKLRQNADLKIGVEFEMSVPSASANAIIAELRQLLEELGLGEAVRIE